MIKNGIETADRINAMCRDYTYSWFWRKYKPSTIKFQKNDKKHNINQDAMQSYCLMIHLPFILFKLRDKLKTIWPEIGKLLQLLQILYSRRIRKSDVDRLAKLIKNHLTFLVEMGENLLPKHHFVTHYPNLILKVGPLIHLWMMRFESKHKTFTDLTHLTNNHKNLPLTLVNRHQEQMCVNRNSAFNIKMQASKTTYNICMSSNFMEYESFLSTLIVNNSLHGLKFFLYGSFEYRPGLLLVENDTVHEIIHIIARSPTCIFLCNQYKIVQFDCQFNSIEIEKIESSHKLVDFGDLKNRKSYGSVSCNNKKFIIADTLDVYDKI